MRAALAELDGRGMNLYLDYPFAPTPHWQDAPHAPLQRLLARQDAEFVARLKTYVPLLTTLREEKLEWQNGWFQALDAFMAYAVVATHKPKRVIEIGSGFSTTFIAAARNRWSPETHLTSIDPHPRAEIDALCNTVVRRPLEDADRRIFEPLDTGDVLFIDSSHRVFTNTDVTTLFLDVIPFLKPGVLIHVHDIHLPRDYPPEWSDRFYSEQYLLAALLLGGRECVEVFMPNAYIGQQNLAPAELREFGAASGVSFWLRKT
jgi:predicted O-methyltransferase YrrM